MNCCPFHSFEGFDMTWVPRRKLNMNENRQHLGIAHFVDKSATFRPQLRHLFLIKLGKCMERSGKQNLCNGQIYLDLT